ncbi:MAG: hypothetical protein WAP47_20850 [Candidatus Rokuibacteriota bacterium]
MTRTIATFLVLAQLVAGCATLRSSPPQGKTAEGITVDRSECSEVAAKDTDSGPLKEGVVVGGLVGAWLILEGASQGAGWGFLTGGSAADGAWIGAAVGAGIGTIVGLVVGIKKGVEKHRQYKSAYDRCLAERGYAVSSTGV